MKQISKNELRSGFILTPAGLLFFSSCSSSAIRRRSTKDIYLKIDSITR